MKYPVVPGMLHCNDKKDFGYAAVWLQWQQVGTTNA